MNRNMGPNDLVQVNIRLKRDLLDWLDQRGAELKLKRATGHPWEPGARTVIIRQLIERERQRVERQRARATTGGR